ncbi:MAG: hypothetical protein WBP93_06330 [Pyrinomonadaceae bacterium]
MMMTETELKTPYKGLIPYSEEDADFFFGREREQNSITSNLIAERLTLLYGGSGVGKSSVLRAGVEHHLRQLAEQNIKRLGKPKYVVVVFNDWRDADPVRSLLNKVREAVTKTLKGQQVGVPAPSLALTEALREWSQRIKGQLLIILDQFEEYFLYHSNEDGEGTFATEFPRAVNTPDLPVNFLVSFREDAMSKLDFFKVRMPGLFGNFLRVEHLNREGGEKAVKNPLVRYNEQIQSNGFAGNFSKVEIEDDLVDEVLKQVKVGEKLIGESGLGGVEKGSQQPASDLQIETPYLQLVMTRIWEEELRIRKQQNSAQDEPLVLRLKTLNNLKGAEHIVQTHLDSVMAELTSGERDLGSKLFKYMVTPSGTKIAQTVSDLADYAKLSPAKETQLATMMETLSSGDKRIFRVLPPPPHQKDSPRYEVFHDRLAEAIIEWRRRYSAKQQRRRWVLIAGALTALLLFMLGMTTFAFQQRKEAKRLLIVSEQARGEAEVKKQEALRAEAEVKEQYANALEFYRKEQMLKKEVENKSKYAEEKRKEAEAQKALAEQQRAVAINEKRNVEAEKQKTEAALVEAKRARAEAERQAEEAKKQKLAADAAAEDAEKQKAIAEEQRNKAKAALETVHEIDSSNAYYKAVMRGHDGKVTYAVLSNDAQKVLTMSDDASVRVWKVNKADDEADLPAITSDVGTITAAAFSPDGRFVVTTSHASQGFGGILTIWDVSKDKPENLASAGFTEGAALSSVQFSPDGKTLLYVNPETGVLIQKWDAEKRELSDPPPSFASDATSAAFSGDGKLVVTANVNDAEVWDASTGKKLQALRHGANGIGVKTAAFSPSGRYVITTSDDNSIRVFETQSGKPVATFGLDSSVNVATISPDEKYLVAVAEGDNKAQLFDVSTKKKLVDLTGHTGAMTGADFSPDGKYVVTSSADKTSRIWDLTGKLIAELRGHTGAVNTAFFDPQSKYVVTSSDDKTARVWEISNDASQVSSDTRDLVPQGLRDGSQEVSIDLDQTTNGVQVEDISWSIWKTGDRRMTPLGSARIVVVSSIRVRIGLTDFEKLSVAQLQGLNYSNVSISGNDDKGNELSEGDIFAVLTTEGNYAKVQVVKYGETLKIRWVTYRLNTPRQQPQQKPTSGGKEVSVNLASTVEAFAGIGTRSDPQSGLASSIFKGIRPFSAYPSLWIESNAFYGQARVRRTNLFANGEPPL